MKNWHLQPAKIHLQIRVGDGEQSIAIFQNKRMVQDMSSEYCVGTIYHDDLNTAWDVLVYDDLVQATKAMDKRVAAEKIFIG